jgi:hypothetical protein
MLGIYVVLFEFIMAKFLIRQNKIKDLWVISFAIYEAIQIRTK